MIEFKKGNLFSELDKVEALINTVNIVGVMGKGIAKEFKIRYPEMYKEYRFLCSNKDLNIGWNYVYKIPNYKKKYVINFPTKRHWRSSSKLEYIEKGLIDLKEVVAKYDIKSIAMPALGCGNGGLDWNIVKPVIVEYLKNMDDVQFIIYEPNGYKVNEKANKVKKPKLSLEQKILLLLMKKVNTVNRESKITFKEINSLIYLLYSEKKNMNFSLKEYGVYAPENNKIINHFSPYYILPLEKRMEYEATQIEIVTTDFPKKHIILNSKEFKTATDLISDFEDKNSLKLLTFVLWFYKKYNDQEKFKEKLNLWIELNNFKYSDQQIQKAIQRIEGFFKNV